MIIAGAGGAAHLPGMIAALTPLPVFGVPVQTKALNGAGQPALDRPDAGRHSGRHAGHRRGRRHQCRAARRRRPGARPIRDRRRRSTPSARDQTAAVPQFPDRRCLTRRPLPPGSTIGILGGGQLGRMLALAAAGSACRPTSIAPIPDSPAFDVTPHKTVAAYDDEAALAAFADAVDVVTYEFENVPAATAEFLAALQAAAARRQRAGRSSQDRLAEKAFLAINGIPVAPYRRRRRRSTDLDAALDELGVPAVLKTTRLGYDGKGQRIVRERAEAAAAFADAGAQAAGARSLRAVRARKSRWSSRAASTARSRAFDPAENVHRDHILTTSTVPADISAETAEQARRDRRPRSSTALDYVGVLGVEFFVLAGRQAAGQRDRAARAQFRPLDRGRVRHRPVRAAHPRHLRLAARRSRAGWPTW